MLNNMTNFFATIAARLVKRKPLDTDLIAVGTKNPNYGGGYSPTAITYKDLKEDVIASIPNSSCMVELGLNYNSIGPKVSFKKPDYATSTVDVIIPGELVLARKNNQGLFNAAIESAWDSNVSPDGTSWNSQFTDLTNFGWGNLGNVNDRAFGTFYDALDQNIGCEIVGMKLVMRHNDSGRLWIIEFTEWTPGANGGGFAYDRYELFPSTFFWRPYRQPLTVDQVSPGLIIKRDNIRGLYNAVLETQYDSDCDKSPLGTEWNSIYTDSTNYGSTNLAQVRNRKYGTWRDAVNGNPPGAVDDNLILVMHDLSTDLYWMIQFLYWGANGNNGEFVYTRSLIPQDCGVQFNDGTVMTTAGTGGTTCCPVLDGEGNLIIDDNSANTVNVGPGGTHLIPNFSGFLLVNDHFDGGVETWIAGGGDTICLGATNTGGGPVGSSLTISGSGYEWTNLSSMNGPFTFTVIKTRDVA